MTNTNARWLVAAGVGYYLLRRRRAQDRGTAGAPIESTGVTPGAADIQPPQGGTGRQDAPVTDAPVTDEPAVAILAQLADEQAGWDSAWRAERATVERIAAPSWAAVRSAWPQSRVLAMLRTVDERYALATGACAGACWGESRARPVGYSMSRRGSDLGLGQILRSRWSGARAWRADQAIPEPEVRIAASMPHWSMISPVLAALAVGSELARLEAKRPGATADDEAIAAWWRGSLSYRGTEANQPKRRTVTTGRSKGAAVTAMGVGEWRGLLERHAGAAGLAWS